MTVQEIKLARQAVRARVNEWKQRNEGWENQESLTVLDKQVGENTYKSYLTTLPLYLSWANTTPDAMVNDRLEHMKSTDKPIRFHFEDSIVEYKNYLIENHYKASSIKTLLSRVSGFFANHRMNLNMEPSFWKRSDKFASKVVDSMSETRRYPTNDEVQLILQLANRTDNLAIILSYQTGLMPVDIVGLTWNQINIDFENEIRDFVFVENVRQKTKALHLIVLSPDAIAGLKSEWVAQGKPTTGYVFRGQVAGTNLKAQSIPRRFKDYSIKALGEMRGSKLQFKDLRQSYNEAILDAQVQPEVKDTLMGHIRKGSKASYSISSASVAKIYQDKIFSKLAVNGWLTKKHAEGYPELKTAISQLESENNALRTRVNLLQTKVDDIPKLIIRIMHENGIGHLFVPEDE
jgi:integrase